MRITDNSIRANFLSSYTTIKSDLNKLQNQQTTQRLINKPSDSPGEISPLMKLNEQLDSISSYKKNIDNSFALVNSLISTMSSVQTTAAKTRDDLAGLKNTITDNSVITTSIQAVDTALKNMLEYANTKFDGKNLFGGTDHTNTPFKFDTGTNAYVIGSSQMDGKQNVEIGNGLEVNTSYNGAQVFGSIIKESGNFDVNAANGTVINQQQQIYDADGNAYNFNVSYTKTAANTYAMAYNITDSTNAVVSSANSNLVFDATTGKLATLGGSTPQMMKIQVSSKKINFSLSVSDMLEANAPATVSTKINQKADILNTLMSVKSKLETGQKVNSNQLEVIDGFYGVVTDNLSIAGDVYNKLEDSESIAGNNELELKSLISKRNDVDAAKLLVELNTKQYNLDTLYKISSMLLPKSLIDYL